jgi:3'(2'), 5'-bisphosphate nucleotidase
MNLINSLKTLIIDAGKIAVDRKRGALIVEHKDDCSPVTNADKEIDALICDALRSLTPDIGIISEEGDDNTRSQAPAHNDDRFWLIDPIDGTKSYIKGEDTYTINIGLIENNKPTIGFIYQPDKEKLYYTDSDGKLKIEEGGQEIIPPIHSQSDPYIAVIGTHSINKDAESVLNELAITQIHAVPSSLKLCYIAEGVADIYPNLSPKMQWDVAAGHALILASGGKIFNIAGKELTYDQTSLTAPCFFAYSKRLVDFKATTTRK